MWFRRGQNKNRRLHRGHVLNVKLRSSQLRAARVRLATMTGGALLGTVFGLYLLWRSGEWALDKFVYENSDFAIQRVDVQTDGKISPEQLRSWSGVKPGENLVALDLAAVKRKLELVSTIDAVSIERVLPRTLKISVTERVPVAQVNVPRVSQTGEIIFSVFQLDANGVVMQPVDPRQRFISLAQTNAQLPVITGINFLQLQPGHRIDAAQLQTALQLIGAFTRSPMAAMATLRQLDISSPGIVTAMTGQGSEITFGRENLEQQLRRWREIYDLGRRNNQKILTADLAVMNNVPVQFAAIETAPEVAPKIIQPAKNRRKNV
jgi:cell division septal protein FtsQ